jgi:hypothetical protein
MRCLIVPSMGAPRPVYAAADSVERRCKLTASLPRGEETSTSTIVGNYSQGPNTCSFQSMGSNVNISSAKTPCSPLG